MNWQYLIYNVPCIVCTVCAAYLAINQPHSAWGWFLVAAVFLFVFPKA